MIHKVFSAYHTARNGCADKNTNRSRKWRLFTEVETLLSKEGLHDRFHIKLLQVGVVLATAQEHDRRT